MPCTVENTFSPLPSQKYPVPDRSDRRVDKSAMRAKLSGIGGSAFDCRMAGTVQLQPHLSLPFSLDIHLTSLKQTALNHADSNTTFVPTGRAGRPQFQATGDLLPTAKGSTYNSTCPLDLLGQLCYGLFGYLDAG